MKHYYCYIVLHWLLTDLQTLYLNRIPHICAGWSAFTTVKVWRNVQMRCQAELKRFLFCGEVLPRCCLAPKLSSTLRCSSVTPSAHLRQLLVYCCPHSQFPFPLLSLSHTRGGWILRSCQTHMLLTYLEENSQNLTVATSKTTQLKYLRLKSFKILL